MLRPSWATKSKWPNSSSCNRKHSSEFMEKHLIRSVFNKHPYINTRCSSAVHLVSTGDSCATDSLCFMQFWKEPLGELTFIGIRQAMYV